MLENKIERLENEIQTLSRAVFRGGAGVSTQGGQVIRPSATLDAGTADLQVRLTQLETQLRQLTGQIEEIRHLATQANSRLDKMQVDVETRFQGLNTALAPTTAPAASSTPTTSPAPTPAPEPQVLGTLKVSKDANDSSVYVATNDANADYETAFGFLRAGDYVAARAMFAAYMTKHPDHRLVSNARYWVAETYYAEGNFEEAARGFASAYQDFPEAAKASDNLLKLALSLQALKRDDEACVTLDQLLNGGVEVSSSVRTRAQSERDALQCGA